MPAQPYIGELMIFAGNFPPRGWAQCNGQLLAISQNTALFSILGTTYGGNGTSNFALPDLRSRATIGEGQGPGLSPYTLGETAGTEIHTLTTTEMPAHTHAVNAVNNGNSGGTNVPGNTVLLGAGYAVEANNPAVPIYSTDAPSQLMSPQAVGVAGGNQPHENRMPFLALNWCIALIGVFPSRN
jgi:microcystin-dependent protein